MNYTKDKKIGNIYDDGYGTKLILVSDNKEQEQKKFIKLYTNTITYLSYDIFNTLKLDRTVKITDSTLKRVRKLTQLKDEGLSELINTLENKKTPIRGEVKKSTKTDEERIKELNRLKEEKEIKVNNFMVSVKFKMINLKNVIGIEYKEGNNKIRFYISNNSNYIELENGTEAIYLKIQKEFEKVNTVVF